VTRNVIFEKKVNDNWCPVHSTELKKGDITRLREPGGEVLKAADGFVEYKVVDQNGVDPDSHHRFDIGLEPIT